MRNVAAFFFLLFFVIGCKSPSSKSTDAAVVTAKSGEQAQVPLFKDGDKVNFIGNSITHGGEFHTNIMLFYATRFPDRNITFYNSGIWGDNANDILKRLETDILPKQADWSIIMAGMNDVNRSLYTQAHKNDPNLESEKQRFINNYRGYMEQVIQRLQKTGTKIILQKPSIYDQTGNLAAENQVGVNDALQKVNGIVDELAKKYNVRVVDYWTIMQKVNGEVQKVNPAGTIVSNDRIHPGAVGSFVMAYQFLKETGAPQYVSKVEIGNGAVRNCLNCTATEIQAGKDNLTFKLQENSLPFPLSGEAEKALELVPFTEQMNVQELKVSDLAAGNYSLRIDDVFVGNYTADELAKGVNLAKKNFTPQYAQALHVRELAEKHRALQKQLRDIWLVEVRYLPTNIWTASAMEQQTFMAGMLQDLQAKNNQRYAGIKKYFEGYSKTKPLEKELEKQAASLMESLRKAAQPVAHTYKLKLLAPMPPQNAMYFGLNHGAPAFGRNMPGVINVDYGYPGEPSMEYVKSKGMSLVRLSFKWERLQLDLFGPLNPIEVARLKHSMEIARANGIWIIMDLHNYCRRKMNGKEYIIGEPGLPVEAIVDFWGKMAKEFKSMDNIYGYDLMNEPHDLLPTVPWFEMAQKLIYRIREEDTKTPIIVSGDDWSSAARWPEVSDNLKNLKDPSNNLIYQAHQYFDEDASGSYKKSYDLEKTTATLGVERAKPFVEWLKKNNLRGIMGEYGIPDNDERWLVTLDNLLKYLQSNCVGGTYWAAGPRWGKNFMAVEPINGVERPQMKVLEKYTVADKGCK